MIFEKCPQGYSRVFKAAYRNLRLREQEFHGRLRSMRLIQRQLRFLECVLVLLLFVKSACERPMRFPTYIVELQRLLESGIARSYLPWSTNAIPSAENACGFFGLICAAFSRGFGPYQNVFCFR